MATLQKTSFARKDVSNNYGASYTGACFPTIVAAFTGFSGNEVANNMKEFDKRRGGTRVSWSSPASTINKALGYNAASDVLTGYDKKGTTTQVAKSLESGVYVIIHRGHAYGLIVAGRKAYAVDYDDTGNCARRQVWTVTKMEGVCPFDMLERAQAGKAANEAKKEESKREFTVGPEWISELTRTVNVMTEDGYWHSLKTAEHSREFVRAHGNDKGVSTHQWNLIHALQF